MFWSLTTKEKCWHNIASVLDSALLLEKYTADFSQQLKKVKNFINKTKSGGDKWLLSIMASYSRLDTIYRKILLSRFFTKGWGRPDHLKRIFELRRQLGKRDVSDQT